MENFLVSVRKYLDRLFCSENKRKAAAFWEKNKRYFFAVILFVVLLLVLYNCTGPTHRRQKESTETEDTESSQTRFTLDESYEKDAIPEVNQLIAAYLDAYAIGDMDALEKVAYPLSENEKSYIGVFSQYFESYQNIICYTKKGVDEGSYFVSVYYDLKFYGVDTMAPGLHMFYVETDENGNFYINNLYSQFNRDVRPENEGDPTIRNAIQLFERQPDLVKMQQEIDAKYREAKAADANLATVIDVTIPGAMRTWLDSQQSNLPQGEDTQTESPTETESQSTQVEPEPEPQPEPEPEPEPQPEPEPEPEPEPQPVKVQFLKSHVNIRDGAGTEGTTVIGQGNEGETYTKVGESGDWTQIDYDGTTGYVKSEYLQTVTN